MKVGPYFERYLKLRKSAGISELTIKSECDTHLYLWRFLGRERDELNITEKDIQTYMEYLAENSDLNWNTRRQRVKKLRSFYKEAVRQGWIIQNPMLRIELPKGEYNPIRVLSVAQMKKLLSLPDISKASGIRDRAIMELLYSTGLRSKELLELKVDDFRESYRLVRVKGKGNKEVMQPIGKMSAYFLSFYIEKLYPKLNKYNQPKVFLSLKHGQPLRSCSLRKLIREYGDKLQAHISLSPHVFRYSVCTHLAEEGVDIRILQEFMRHDSIQSTSRYIKESYQYLQRIHRKTHPRA